VAEQRYRAVPNSFALAFRVLLPRSRLTWCRQASTLAGQKGWDFAGWSRSAGTGGSEGEECLDFTMCEGCWVSSPRRAAL